MLIRSVIQNSRTFRMILLLGLFVQPVYADIITLAQVRASGDITTAPNGDLYVSDFGNPSLGNGNSIVRLQTDGMQNLFAQNLSNPLAGNDFDSQGNLFQAALNGNVYRITPDGTATIVANPANPVGLVINHNDVVYVTQCNANTIARIGPGSTVTALVTGRGLSCPNGLDIGHDGALYTVNFNDGGMYRIGLDGSISLFAQIPGNGNGHVVFVNDHYYVAGRQAHRVFQVDTQGTIVPYAGSGVDGNADGPNLTATISRPNGIGASPDGRFLYIVGSSNFNASVLPVRVIDLPASEPAFAINAGLSGTWADPNSPGQGFFMDVSPAIDTVFASWFTFDQTNAGPNSIVGFPSNKWFIALGTYVTGSDTVVLDLIETDGGVFDETMVVEETTVGSLTLNFENCSMATADYQFDESGLQGQIPLSRLTSDELCLAISAP